MRQIVTYALVAVMVMAGCNRNTSPSERIVPVGVVVVADANSSYSRNYLGNVTSSRQHFLLAPAPGTGTDLKVRVGQKVREGSLIASVSSPNIVSFHNANQATLRQAEDGYARARKMYEGGGISEVKWMEVRTKLEQARSAAEISQKSLDDCTIKAPFTGTVSEVGVTSGEEVVALQKIAVIIDEDDLEVSIHIPENEYSSISEGVSCNVRIPALDDVEVRGKVVDLGVNSTSISHSYIAKIRISGAPSGLKAGMACKVFLDTNLESRIIVPASAVKTDDLGRYLWVVAPGNTVEKRRVKVAGFADSGVAVKEGLENGEMVICQGISKVSTGMKVTPQRVDLR